jgi:hypothetical protein
MTAPPATRVYRLYRFYDRAGALLYIGETGRLPFVRMLEHIYDQPWADEIGSWVEDPRAWPSEASVLAAEEAAIRAELPRYNYEHNLGNPHRVPVYRQGVRRRVPMSQSSRHRVGRPRRALAAARRTPRAVWWLAAWLVLAATFSTYCIVRAHVGVRDGLIVGCVGAAGALIGVARARRPRRRRRRRRW